MRNLIISALLLISGSAMASQYRYDCRAFYFEQDSPSAPVHGCSTWYSQSSWNAVEAKRQAVDAAKLACQKDSGENRCYLAGCRVDTADHSAPSLDCPAI